MDMLPRAGFKVTGRPGSVAAGVVAASVLDGNDYHGRPD
jgi:hypothetical protein